MAREVKEWTIMFYFASDNPLASTIISQLKAIKDAGYHPEANVIAQFDPYIVKTPSHIFEVSIIEKIKDPDGAQGVIAPNDPFVRGLLDDKIWGEGDEDIVKKIQEELPVNGGDARRAGSRAESKGNYKRSASLGHGGRGKGGAYKPPTPSAEMSGEQPPRERLSGFLDFCRENYPARHYMLIVLGHGLAVGNDLFLFDEHAPQSTLLLCEMGDVLRQFRVDIQADDEKAEFELLGFHSCSMSGLEVAYELRNTARFMLASQGPAFVGSWPYRQILLRVINSLKSTSDYSQTDIDDMIRLMFYSCLHNSQDFQLAGYSFDICLCNLRKLEEDATDPLKQLSEALRDGLKDPRAKEHILLAHWDAQSFWQETYTDIYDFCLCLWRRCRNGDPAQLVKKKGDPPKPATMSDKVAAIHDACESVMEALKRGRKPQQDDEEAVRAANDRAVVRAEAAGPLFQYAHGLSVFFPWSEPIGSRLWDNHYEDYRFNRKTGWMKFLKEYFKSTMRIPRNDENDQREIYDPPQLHEGLLERINSNAFNTEGHRGPDNRMIITVKDGASDPLGKFGSHDPAGKFGTHDPAGKYGTHDPAGETEFTGIKNYPRFTRLREDRRSGRERRNGGQDEPQSAGGKGPRPGAKKETGAEQSAKPAGKASTKTR